VRRTRPAAHRAARASKGDEQAVTLAVDLDPTALPDSVAKQSPVLIEDVAVRPGSKHLRKACRILHVGKEEGDSAARKIHRSPPETVKH
jgi:hypothetical protein